MILKLKDENRKVPNQRESLDKDLANLHRRLEQLEREIGPDAVRVLYQIFWQIICWLRDPSYGSFEIHAGNNKQKPKLKITRVMSLD